MTATRFTVFGGATAFFALAVGLSFAALPAGTPPADGSAGLSAWDWVWVALVPAGVFVAWWVLREPRPLAPGPHPPNVMAAAGVAGMLIAILVGPLAAAGAQLLVGESRALGGLLTYALGFGLAAIPAALVLAPPTPGSRRRAVPTGVLLWLAVLPVANALVLVNVWLVELAGRAPAVQAVLEEFAAAPAWERWVTVIPVVLLAPLFEEVIFRGAIYRGLRELIGVWPAAIASGLLFSAIHFAAPQALPIFALGVALALLYERAGTLGAPIAAHACHNALALTYTLLAVE